MNQDERCGNCRWWCPPPLVKGGGFYPDESDDEWGYCRLTMIGDAETEGLPTLAVATPTDTPGETVDARIETKAEFGCVQWTAKL